MFHTFRLFSVMNLKLIHRRGLTKTQHWTRQIKIKNKTKTTWRREKQKKKTIPLNQKKTFSFYLCRFSHISFHVCVCRIHVWLSYRYKSFLYSFSVDEKCFWYVFFSIRSSVHQASKTQLSFCWFDFYLFLLEKKNKEY